jgi:hypothetical protein
MAIQQGLTTSFKQNLLLGTQSLGVGPFKMALYTAFADLGPNTTVYSATNEVSGTGYTAGGETMTGLTVQANAQSGTVYANFANVSWPGANFTARGALIYDSGNGDKSVAVLDFGSDKQFSNVSNTVTMPANTATTALIRFP